MRFYNNIKLRVAKWAVSGLQRGFSEVTGVGQQMSDWIMQGISDDADLWTNWRALVERSRDLFKLNPYMRKFRKDLIANVFGSEGIALQMKIKEEADRVVYAEEEKAWLDAKQRAHDDLRKRAKRHGIKLRKREFLSRNYQDLYGADGKFTGRAWLNGSTKAKAVVKAGQPDVYANNLIERAWKRWQKRENCTVTKRHTYAQTREHRLTMCARDGDVFIRHVRGGAARNEFGYAIQIIASEWIDHGLNTNLEGGNYIKMGVEYDQWNAVAAYYVIKRQPGDWRYAYSGGSYSSAVGPGRYGSANGMRDTVDDRYERVLALDMIHYCAFDDAESGRAAPWIASVIPKLRHLDKYSEAEVISARAEACKGGHYEAAMPGLDATDLADVMTQINAGEKRLTQVVEPAMWKALPWGWTAKAHDPKHPNGNYPAFKKEALREICAGINDQYITFSGDLEGTSYSSGRIGSLDVRELWMLTQRFDIDTAEIPIFEAWLEMSLTTGAIPLPLSKIEKFKQAQFQGRRWPWVDPLKDAKGDAARLDMFATSEFRITNENGDDFEEIVEERALAKVLIEEAGFNVANAQTIPEESPDGTIPEPVKSRLEHV